MQIGAADRRQVYLNDCVARILNFGIRHGFDANVILAIPAAGFHRFSPVYETSSSCGAVQAGGSLAGKDSSEAASTLASSTWSLLTRTALRALAGLWRRTPSLPWG